MAENQSLDEGVNDWKAKVQRAFEEWLEAELIATTSQWEEGDSKVATEKWVRFMKLVQGEELELPEGYVLFDPWNR